MKKGASDPNRPESAAYASRVAVARALGVAPPYRADQSRAGWISSAVADPRDRLASFNLATLLERTARGVAFHEAGHLLAAIVLGMRVKDVEWAPGDTLGGAMFYYPPPVLTPGVVRACLAVSLAGGEAMFRYSGNRAEAHESASADRESDTALIARAKLGKSGEADARRDAAIVCDAILTHTWPAIRTIARLLMLRRRLGAEEIYRVLWRFERRPPDDIVHAVRTLASVNQPSSRH